MKKQGRASRRAVVMPGCVGTSQHSAWHTVDALKMFMDFSVFRLYCFQSLVVPKHLILLPGARQVGLSLLNFPERLQPSPQN